MPLPSQTARTASIGRATMYRRKRSNLRPFAGVGLGVAVIGVLVWGVARFAFGGPDQPLSPKGASAQVPAAAGGPEGQAPGKLLGTDGPAPAKPAEKPLFELQQGRSGGQDTTRPGTTPALNQPVLGHTPGVPVNEVAAKPTPAPISPPALPPQGGGGSVPSDLVPGVTAARQKLAAGDLVTARVLLSRVLADARLSESERVPIRAELTKINDDLVFSPRVAKDDPFTDYYTVQSNDNLTKIAQKLGLGPDRRLLKRVNRLANEHKINLGQKLKVVKGPFHAVVNKSAYRMDVYMGPTDRRDQWVYVRSFRVGLGEEGSTPVGNFIVKKGSKLVDPPWIHPQTGEHFAGGDPKNPIGRYWIAIEGIGDAAQYTGFGIHGTIDPGSIGQQRSMGCVRMMPEDIELMYELMGETVSTVQIVP